MKIIFWEVVNRSFSAGVLIAVTLFLRILLRRAPKRMRYILWLFVAIQLVCPLNVESTFSLMPDVGAVIQERFPEGGLSPEENGGFAERDGENPLGYEFNPMGYEYELHPMGHDLDSMGQRNLSATVWLAGSYLPWIWVLGMAGMAGYGIVSFVKLKRSLRTAVRMEGNLWQSDRVVSPFIMGIIRPRIYLPFSLREPAMTYVLAHERIHIRQGDHIIKPLSFVLLAVYWFHPLIWVAFILMCRDMELACDERVVRKLGKRERKAYAESLLALSVKGNGIAACPVAFGETEVKGRIRAILNYKRPGVWMVLLAATACAAACVCFLTKPGESDAALLKEQVMPKVEEQVQIALQNSQEYEPEAGYDDWRLESVELCYEYKQLLGTDLVLYRYNYLFHAEHPEKVLLAGATEILEGDWVQHHFNSEYLCFQRTSGGLRFLFSMFENDCFPGDDVFTNDLLVNLTWHRGELIEGPEIEDLEALRSDKGSWIYDRGQTLDKALEFFNEQNLGGGIYARRTADGYEAEYIVDYDDRTETTACVQGTEEDYVIVTHMDRKAGGYWQATGYHLARIGGE